MFFERGKGLLALEVAESVDLDQRADRTKARPGRRVTNAFAASSLRTPCRPGGPTSGRARIPVLGDEHAGRGPLRSLLSQDDRLLAGEQSLADAGPLLERDVARFGQRISRSFRLGAGDDQFDHGRPGRLALEENLVKL